MDDLHLKVTRAFNLELPPGANGDSPYTYMVSVLPSGLDFDDQTRFISGTPDTPGNDQMSPTRSPTLTGTRSRLISKSPFIRCLL